MMLRIGVFFCAVFVLVLTPLVAAAPTTCSINTTRIPSVFSPGETITFEMVCTGDANKAYQIAIYNSTGGLQEQLTGTTSATNGVLFFTNWVVPINYPLQNRSSANMTVTGKDGFKAVRFNVTGLATNTLFVHDPLVLYNGTWVWDEVNAISAVVHDYNGNAVVNAKCDVTITDESGNPFFDTDEFSSNSLGNVVIPIFTDFNVFDIGSYLWTLSCHTDDSSQSVSFPNYGDLTARGDVSGTFVIEPHVIVNEVYMQGHPNVTVTQSSGLGCVNVSNNYRDYSSAIDIVYRMLCDIPNQDVTVIEDVGHEVLESNQTVTYCLPVVVPESAAQGTGYCRITAGIRMRGYENNFEGDYSGTSGLFYVYPTFPTVVVPVKLYGGQSLDSLEGEDKYLRGVFGLRRYFSAGEELRIDMATGLLQEYGWDVYETLYATYYNGSELHNSSCTLSTGLVSKWDAFAGGSELYEDIAIGTDGVRNMEIHCVLDYALESGTNVTLTAHLFSYEHWHEAVLRELTEFFDGVLSFLGIGKTVDAVTVGNYTSVSSQVFASTVGASNDLIMQVNITGGNSSARRNLHFVYEFAPISAGVEGAFADQNPSIEGYQALSVWQVISLNQTKSFALRLAPALSVGNYTMYEVVYEQENAQPIGSGDVVRDERIIYQRSHSIIVDADMVPDFDGSIMKVEGVIMQSVS